MAPEVVVRRKAIALTNHYLRVRSAAEAGALSGRDPAIAVTSAVVRFTLEIERQLETLFVQLVLGTRSLPGVRPIVSIRSAVVLHSHIRQGRKYADWLPYEEQTMKRADLFLSGGRPFRSMSEPGLTALKELTALRNVLAHDSRHSRKQFERVVLSQRAVPSYERTVDRYLLGIDIAPSSRLETHLARVVAAFEELV